jgi:hypothetical protein
MCVDMCACVTMQGSHLSSVRELFLKYSRALRRIFMPNGFITQVPSQELRISTSAVVACSNYLPYIHRARLKNTCIAAAINMGLLLLAASASDVLLCVDFRVLVVFPRDRPAIFLCSSAQFVFLKQGLFEKKRKLRSVCGSLLQKSESDFSEGSTYVSYSSLAWCLQGG